MCNIEANRVPDGIFDKYLYIYYIKYNRPFSKQHEDRSNGGTKIIWDPYTVMTNKWSGRIKKIQKLMKYCQRVEVILESNKAQTALYVVLGIASEEGYVGAESRIQNGGIWIM